MLKHEYEVAPLVQKAIAEAKRQDGPGQKYVVDVALTPELTLVISIYCDDEFTR